MTPPVEVAIVIPTHDGRSDLARLLDAIHIQDGPYRAHVVAVDSGSTDGTPDLLAERGATVLRVPPAEFNHGETRNIALRCVDSEFAVVMVQDALPASPAWLRSLVEPLQQDPQLAGTWARQLPREGASRLTAHYLSHWAGSQPTRRLVGPVTRAEFASMTPADRMRLCTFDNVCACLRMSVWRRHPFRASRIAEDLEWAVTVLHSGYRLAYVPEAAVFHSHDRSAGYELRRTYAVHQRLQSLFGLATIPGIPALARAVAGTLPLHLCLAAGEPRGRGRALARAVGLALALPLGQYLGARSAREGREFMDVRGV